MKLRFVHVPKTAGTTVLTILNLQYPGTRKFVFRGDWGTDVQRWESMSIRDRNSVGVVSGHAPLKTGIGVIDAAPSFMLLRDPIERVASFCRHALDPKKEHYVKSRGIKSIDDLLDNPVREIKNFQTGMLLLEGAECNDSKYENLESFEDPVSSAKLALFRNIDAFGIQEKFDQSMVLAGLRFNWRPPVYLVRNRSDASVGSDFTPEQVDKIISLILLS